MPDHTLRIATAAVNWNNNDIPGWRDPVPFPDLLDRMVEAGYRTSEYDDKFGPEPDVVGAAARERGIELCGFYQWMDLQDDDAFAADLKLVEGRLRQLGELGCQHLIIADRMRPERISVAGRVPDDGSMALSAAGMNSIADHAAAVAQLAARLGFSTHYHNHVGTYVETAAEVADFAGRIAGTGIDFCFDTGHFAYGGGDSLSFLTRHLDQVGHLHLKDVDGEVLARSKAKGEGFLDALRALVFAPLGDGSAQIAEIVRLLVERHYEHWIVIEQDTCAGDPTETARRNRQFVIDIATREEAA